MSEALAAGAELVGCALCGHRFDPRATNVCASCPLGKGCSLACCPNCGYSAPDPSRSTVVRLAARAAAALAGRRRVPAGAGDPARPGGARLQRHDRDAGATCRSASASSCSPTEIAPGRVVDVLQVRPVTIVRVEHAELAFETTLSRAIGIAAPPQGGP